MSGSEVRSTTAGSRELGEELRRVRRRAGLTTSFVSAELEWSTAKLSKLESGARGASEADVATLLNVCRADKATRARLLRLAGQEDRELFVRAHSGGVPDELLCLRMHEALAVTISGYTPLVVPPLLQSAAYADALLAPLVDDVDERAFWLRSRLDRQQVLHGTRPTAVLYLHEAVLRLVVGDAPVMHDQCMGLAFACDWASVRLIPWSAGGHPALRHAAARMTFAGAMAPLAYAETDTATVFLDRDTAIREKFDALDTLALGVARSAEVFRHWAEVYDHASADTALPDH